MKFILKEEKESPQDKSSKIFPKPRAQLVAHRGFCLTDKAGHHLRQGAPSCGNCTQGQDKYDSGLNRIILFHSEEAFLELCYAFCLQNVLDQPFKSSGSAITSEKPPVNSVKEVKLQHTQISVKLKEALEENDGHCPH